MARRKRSLVLDDPPSASSSDEVMEEPSSQAEEETPAKTTQPDPVSKKNLRSAKRDGEGSSRRSKRKKTTTPKGPNVVIRKVWSEGDEIAVLKGMLAFSASIGTGDAADFRDFVYKSSQLDEDFTAAQLEEKIWSFQRNHEKCLSAANGFHSADPHEMRIFQLSNQLWGHAPTPEPNPRDEPGTSKLTPEPKPRPEPGPTQYSSPGGDHWAILGELLKGSSVPESVLRSGLGQVPEDTKANLTARGKKFFLSQMKLAREKNLLIDELNKLIIEALESDK